jgi:hypothetical protein
VPVCAGCCGLSWPWKYISAISGCFEKANNPGDLEGSLLTQPVSKDIQAYLVYFADGASYMIVLKLQKNGTYGVFIMSTKHFVVYI